MLITITEDYDGKHIATSYDGFEGYMDYHDDVDDVLYAIINMPGELRTVGKDELNKWLSEYRVSQDEYLGHIRTESNPSIFI